MPLVAYSVSPQLLFQLDFWADQRNLKEYQDLLWKEAEPIGSMDQTNAEVVHAFSDWLASERGLGLSSRFTTEKSGFVVFFVISADERKGKLPYLCELPEEELRVIPELYGIRHDNSEADCVAIRSFLQNASEIMTDRRDESLIIASC